MDTKTLLLALALGNLSLCAALFFFAQDPRQPGYLSWSRAKQLQAAAWVLLYLRGVLPDFLTIPVANALLFAGFALDAAALWEMSGRRRAWRNYLLPALGAGIAILLGAWLMELPASARIAIASVVSGFYFAAGAAALGSGGGWRSGSLLRRYLVLLMLALAGAVVARGLLPDGLGPVGAPLIQAVGLGALYVMMPSSAFGYLLLAREQSQLELARLEVVDALTDVPNRRGFYHEYTVPTPRSRSRGARRIVCGGPLKRTDNCYYSDDHYTSFNRIVE